MENSAGADPNLDIWTLRVRQYESGHAEGTIYKAKARAPQSDERDRRRAVSTRRRALDDQSTTVDIETQQTNHDRSVSRSRAQMRRHIFSLKADRIITLTTRANITDRAEFHLLVKRWLRLCRGHLPTIAGVGVFEQQKRGAWHLHLAVHGFYDARILRELWLRVCDSGSVNVSRKPGSISRIVRYLSKYLSKSMSETALNLHRYLRMGHIPTTAAKDYRGTLAELRGFFEEEIGYPVFAHFGPCWEWVWVDPDTS